MSMFRRVLLQQTWRPSRSVSRPLSVVSRTEIQSLLDSKKYPYKLGHTSFVLQCPFCRERADASCPATQNDSMFVNYDTGSVVCRPCSIRGSWSDFMKWSTEGKSPTAPPTHHGEEETGVDGDRANKVTTAVLGNRTEQAQNEWSVTTSWRDTASKITDRLRDMLNIKVLTDSSLEKFNVRTTSLKSSSAGASELPSVAFPWYHGEDLVWVETISPTAAAEVRPVVQSKEGRWRVFGCHTVESTSKQLVVTSSEWDAIAVHQSTGLPAIAVPSDLTKPPSELTAQFEQFERVYLWLGSTAVARQTATQLATKLGLKKCYLVSFEDNNRPFPSALEALSNEADLKAIISQSRTFAHDQIFSFHQLRGDVYEELSNREVVSGAKWRRFPRLTSVLKGHRPGELTVFTGPTGRGKTTLLAEMSLDLCSQKVATLWGSFEIKNVRLAKTLIKQYSGVDIERHLDEYEEWADKFQQLPLYFMGFYGSADINTVVKTMSHAVCAHNIQHVIVDNLQFMLGTASLTDCYSAQNQVIGALRRFASTQNVHVTVVIHPRKEDESNPLTTASIFGTAKAAQEADNVLILQCPQGKDKYLQVTKNRFDGDLGTVPLSWDTESCTLSGHFNRPSPDNHTPLPHPPQKTQYTKVTTRPVSKNIISSSSFKPPVSTTIRPQGSKLIGRIQSESVKGSPLCNQANTRSSRGQSRRTI